LRCDSATSDAGSSGRKRHGANSDSDHEGADPLTVQYNMIMQLDDFEDAVYRLMQKTLHCEASLVA